MWESGNVYKGSYVDDERDGYGEMFWTDNSFYQGEWKAGIQHGYGKMTFPDGTIKEGRFENNVFIGQNNNNNTDAELNHQMSALFSDNGGEQTTSNKKSTR